MFSRNDKKSDIDQFVVGCKLFALNICLIFYLQLFSKSCPFSNKFWKSSKISFYFVQFFKKKWKIANHLVLNKSFTFNYSLLFRIVRELSIFDCLLKHEVFKVVWVCLKASVWKWWRSISGYASISCRKIEIKYGIK